MAVTVWLIDKSAYTRLPAATGADTWVDRIERGVVQISTATRLQIGYRFARASKLASSQRHHRSR